VELYLFFSLRLHGEDRLDVYGQLLLNVPTGLFLAHCCMPCSSHPRNDYLSSLWWRVSIMQRFAVQFSVSCCNFLCFVLRENEFHCRSVRNVETKQAARSGVCEYVRWRYSGRLNLLQSFVCLMTSVASSKTRTLYIEFCISSPIINGEDLILASYIWIVSLEVTWNRDGIIGLM
jgi:hypothetical protein